MKNQRNRYNRILLIDRMIASGDMPTISELLGALENAGMGVNRSTLWRDLQVLENEYNAPLDKKDYIAGNERRTGYIYTSKTFRVPAMISSEEKIKSAQMMASLLDSIRGTQVYDETKEVIDELSTEVPVTDATGTAPLKISRDARIIFIGSPCVPIPDDTWNAIRDAINANQLLKFSYRKIGDDGCRPVSVRTVEPYQLIFSRGNWHLWCFDYSRKARRLFNLHEMSDVRARDSSKKNEFVLPNDFDFRLQTPGFFGTFHTNSECRIKIRLSGYAAKYARIRMWGGAQTIEDESGGKIVLSFTTTQFSPENCAALGSPVLTWILGWGDEAVPLSPPELVSLWRAKVESMARIASSIS